MRILDAEISDLEKINCLFDMNTRNDYPVVNEHYFRWQWIETNELFGSTNNKGPIMLVNENEVKGVAFVSKTPYLLGGNKVLGGYNHEWHVDEDIIGQGWGYKLISEQLNRNEVLLSGGISQYYTKLIGRLCKTSWFETPRLFTVLDIENAEALLFSKGPPAKAYLGYCSKVPDYHVINSCVVSQFDENYEQLWLDVCQNFLISTDRTAKYMNWRYIRHPSFNYECWCFETTAGLAYFVWRNETVVGSSCIIARICEVIGNSAAISLAYPAACNEMRKTGITIVDFFCTHAETNMALTDSGMHYVITLPDFDLPRMYSPRFNDPRKTINWVISISDRLFEQSFRNYSKIYITKGDGNQDRPNV